MVLEKITKRSYGTNPTYDYTLNYRPVVPLERWIRNRGFWLQNERVQILTIRLKFAFNTDPNPNQIACQKQNLRVKIPSYLRHMSQRDIT
ncbi:hypothetical protein [Algoriphagus alkaliphilus]|uniref:hypothetical protein n=1 Tax=Algoriphagus alkaliphilus TaxID=279824 RepID=UPI000B876ED1|nr:hypothetical protein [Algoriphagus alkaliphilus]